MINLIPGPSPLPGGRGGAERKFQLSSHMVGSFGSQPSSFISHFIIISSGVIERDSFSVTTQETPKVLEVLCKEPGVKTKYVFCIMSQYNNFYILVVFLREDAYHGSACNTAQKPSRPLEM